MTWLLVAVGGSIGAAARFVVDGEMKARRSSSWPLATLFINALGSFVLGFASASHLSTASAAFVTTGLCGGFTTFSTASVEAVMLFRGRRSAPAIAYVAGTLTLCLTLVVLGGSLAR